IGEFDRTVKTYGGELADRLGVRTSEVADTMKRYVDTFDGRVASRGTEITSNPEQRPPALETGRGSHGHAPANQRAAGGKDGVAAIDQRIGDVGKTIDERGTQVANKLEAKVTEIDTTLGARALEVSNTLDTRINRIAELGETIRTNASQAERSLTDL